MAHMSNRDRIARAAEEAKAAAAEKAEKAVKKKPSKPRASSKRAAPTGRMKIVWDVCGDNGQRVKTFPYPEQAAAQSAAEALTRSSGKTHSVRASKVPME